MTSAPSVGWPLRSENAGGRRPGLSTVSKWSVVVRGGRLGHDLDALSPMAAGVAVRDPCSLMEQIFDVGPVASIVALVRREFERALTGHATLEPEELRHNIAHGIGDAGDGGALHSTRCYQNQWQCVGFALNSHKTSRSCV